MKEEKITIGEKEFIIREILAIELDDINLQDQKQVQRALVTKSAKLTDEEYNHLTLKERLVLVTRINEINGLGDFRQPSK